MSALKTWQPVSPGLWHGSVTLNAYRRSLKRAGLDFVLGGFPVCDAIACQSLHGTKEFIQLTQSCILPGGRSDLVTPDTEPERDAVEEVKSKPIKSGNGPLDRSLRSSRSVTPTPAISIEPDGSLELTADMINGIDNEVITSDTLQSAKARGSNNTGLGVIIPSDDESMDGVLLGEDEDEEDVEEHEEHVEDEQVDMGVGGGVGEAGSVATDQLPGSTLMRTRAVSKTSEEERGHDHERTPQPYDPQEKMLGKAAEEPSPATEQQNAGESGSPTDNVS